MKHLLLALCLMSSSQLLAAEKNKLVDCTVKTIPELILGGGIAAIVSAPLAPVIGIGYYGAAYWRCYDAPSKEKTSKAEREELAAAVDAAVAKSMDAVKEDVARAKQRLEDKDGERERLIRGIEAALQKTAEREKREIESTADRVIREVYREIETLKDAEIRVEETVSGDRKAVEESVRLKVIDRLRKEDEERRKEAVQDSK